MALAIAQARIASDAGEVPVGAVVVRGGQVIASGRNEPIARHDPTAHAEIMALREAANVVGNYRLDDCTLYVTLEPCAMCSGAMLHARLPRVVFGAADPKTGAAGSVVNLFENPKLNHKTSVEGGLLATESSKLLTDFFKARREAEKSQSQPLREDALRSSDQRFTKLQLADIPSKYVAGLPSLEGLRMHYVDVGPQDSNQVVLCLHGDTGWGYTFYPRLAGWVSEGKRVIVPDLIGFGRSDKPKRTDRHTVDFHRHVLFELLAHLHVSHYTLVLHNSLDGMPANAAADNAPFPDAGYRAALKAFAGDGCRVSLIVDALQAHWPA